MRVLGVETSCDETGVAVYEAGAGIRAERLASQIAIHAAYGGVVPELASRDHIAKLLPMVEGVLAEAWLFIVWMCMVSVSGDGPWRPSSPAMMKTRWR